MGTSSGTPTKSRNVTAVAILESKGSDWYLIDCGEGTQHQLLHSNLSVNSLRAVFITHVHGDHCYGLPGLLASAGLNGRRTPLTIVAPKGIKEWFAATQVYTELSLPFDLEFISSESLSSLDFGQFSVSITELSHRVPSFAYSFVESAIEVNLDIGKLKLSGVPQGPLWGKLQLGEDVEYEDLVYRSADFVQASRKPRKVIIGGDNDRPELLQEECKACDVLVHEATYTEDMALKVGDVGHSYAKQVAEFSQSNSVPNLILTHFSARYQSGLNASASIEDIRLEAKKSYSGQLYLAEDFQIYKLEKTGTLRLLA